MSALGPDGYGLARPLDQTAAFRARPQPSGALVALGVMLLLLSVIVPAALALLGLAAAPGGTCTPESCGAGLGWIVVAPAVTALVTFVLAARAIANGGARRRPLRALVHLALGAVVLLIAVETITTATGGWFFRW